MTDTLNENSLEEKGLNISNDDHSIEIAITNLEKQGDSDEHDDEFEIEDEKRDSTDYSSFTKEDFIKKAEDLIDAPNIKESHDIFKKIRVLFDDVIKAERVLLIKEWAEEGKDVREFKPPYDEQKDRFYKVYAKFLEKRAEEKRLAEEEKQKNLKAKQDLLDRLKDIVSTDETEKVFSEVDEIQKQWKQIRSIPRQFMQELWESYRFYLDKFYDNHSINNELKDKDRQKNLEFKIELLKKIDQLKEEKSIKKTHILLNKYHEEFRNIGPVASKEMAEDLWKRFKAASDDILAERRSQMEVIKAKRNENLELKKLLCEKVEAIIQLPIETFKTWKEKGEEMNSIFEEWKTIGPVPDSFNDQIWRRFRESQNTFNQNKKLFFEKLNKGKDENLKLKTVLCEQAEKIASSSQFDSGSKEMIALQEKWKSIGPVPENMNEKIWQRFRKACDTFFAKRNDFYKGKNDEEKKNQEQKEFIISAVEKLIELEDSAIVFEALRSHQQNWMNIGFVPIKVKQELTQKYSQAVDAIYKKFKQASDENKSLRMKDHFEMLSNAPNGSEKLRQEEKLISDKMRALKESVETLNNNIGFFAKSKKADELKQQIEQKINVINAQVSKLQEELKVLRQFRNNQSPQK
ncbi:MAG: DUF349 domain-containing protein [Bacteroidota bacterium]|nr:DUF349 domain-containing protein [Bacteroidota bacterium]